MFDRGSIDQLEVFYEIVERRSVDCIISVSLPNLVIFLRNVYLVFVGSPRQPR